MNNPLGVSPSKGNQGTTRGKEKILLTSVGTDIVWRDMLRAFGQPIVTYWVLKIELVVARTWENDHIMQHPQMLHEKFDLFQIF